MRSSLIAVLVFVIGVSYQATGAENTQKKTDYLPKNFQAKTNTKPITLTGEVVDTWCYCSHVMGTGRGPDHAGCARSCIAGGVVPGILDDRGNLYIASKHRGYQGCRDLLLPYVAERVTVTGWLAEKGGCKVLKITSVKPAVAKK